MSSWDLTAILATSAVLTTILQFLSGAIVCRKYVQKRSTGDTSGMPFVCGFLSCSFWLRYGYLTQQLSIMLVNGVGVLLFLGYTLTYLTYAVDKRTYLRKCCLTLIALFAVLFYTNETVATAPAQTVRFMGIVCCIVSICFIAAPLTMLVHVVRTKSAECLPLPLIATTFVVSLQWLAYGVLIADTFVQIPNFVGSLLALLQLFLFVIYPPKKLNGKGYTRLV